MTGQEVRVASPARLPPRDDAHRMAEVITDTRAGPARQERRHRVRRDNIRAAFGASAAVLAVNAVYFLATADRPNRGLLWALQGLAVAISAAIATQRTPLRRWVRVPVLLHAWTSSQLVIIGLAAVLDGGLTSPLIVLLFVPLTIAAMGFRPAPVIGHCLTAVAMVLLAGAATGTLELGRALLYAAALAATAMVGMAVAHNLRVLTREVDEANAALVRLSRTDALTGCLNHRSFYQELDAALARAGRSATPTALLLVDIDHFKRVNDAHGHPVGDDVLVAVADALRTSTRAGDVVARTGGEEFAVLMPDTPLDAARGVAARVRRAITRAGGPATVTASAGLASAPEHGKTASGLVRTADEALYAAKRAGRDRLVVAEAPAGRHADR